MTKVTREAIRIAKSCGVCQITIHHRSKHIQLLTEFGKITIASSPSDQRWVQHCRANIRRLVRSAANDN